ncbi:hypothetical protein BDV19DRAFT_374517 [Aspergillus venezuelensis]
MEDSFYDSFRWLDKDTDIDLSLTDYQQQATNARPSLPQRRRQSFRRTLSFNSANLTRKSVSHGKASAASPSADSQSVLSYIVSKRSPVSRPASMNKPHHTSRASTSSIDPSAQYYHDPEARLNLRVFLASPQNFDEAIQFGFPAANGDKDHALEMVQACPHLQLRGFKGTFLDDGDGDDDHGWGSTCGTREGQNSNNSRLSYIAENPRITHDLTCVDSKRQSWVPLSERSLKRTPSTREMTLRMTLTRPDLRTDGGLTSTIATDATPPQPQLHQAHEDLGFWEQETEEPNLVSRMWRKFRRRG